MTATEAHADRYAEAVTHSGVQSSLAADTGGAEQDDTEHGMEHGTDGAQEVLASERVQLAHQLAAACR